MNNKEIKEYWKQRCNKCNYEWFSRKPNPKSCPRCHSYYWKRRVVINGDEYVG